MPKNQNEDTEYSNEETILLQDQIKKMKKELIAIKEEECEKIQNALFTEDMKKTFPNCTYPCSASSKIK